MPSRRNTMLTTARRSFVAADLRGMTRAARSAAAHYCFSMPASLASLSVSSTSALK